MSERERIETAPPGAAGQTDSVPGVASDERDRVARQIGERLAQARTAQHASIDEIAARLKVAATKLAAVEQGRVGDLPDLTFAKGLMRAYARALQVDVSDLLVKLNAQPQAVNVGLRPEGGLGETFSERPLGGTSTLRWLWLALLVLVIGGGVLFGLDSIKQWLAERNQETAAAQQAASEPAAQAEAPAVSDTPGTPGTVTATLPDVHVPAAASAPAAVPMPTPVVTASPDAAAAVAAAGEGTVRIRFSGVSWYQVKDKTGKIIASGTAKAGEAPIATGTPPYAIVLGNVGGVEGLEVDGQAVDLQKYARNNVARMTLP